MYIIRFTHYFLQLSKNSKSLTFFVSSECELKSDFQKRSAFGEVSKPRPRVLVTATYRRHAYL